MISNIKIIKENLNLSYRSGVDYAVHNGIKRQIAEQLQTSPIINVCNLNKHSSKAIQRPIRQK